MTATYTWDIFCTLDGYGSYDEHGDWGGYWGKQGPEFLGHRLTQYGQELRLVLGANTYRTFAQLLAAEPADTGVDDDWVTRMRYLPTTVVSNTLTSPLDWLDATLVPGDVVDAVGHLKAESDVPLRSHGGLAINHALMAAGLVDAIQVTIFPVVSGTTGTEPIFGGAADFDLELLSARTFDGRIQELTYRPTRHG
ncbi:MAG: dihydrofolate reductase family protein [Microlunatus sp.]